METTLQVKKVGGSTAIFIPKVYCEHLGIKDEGELILSDDKGKHGNFVAIWNKKQQEE